MSILLNLSSETSGNVTGVPGRFTTRFSDMIRTPENENWEIALHSTTMTYSWYNISEARGNNEFRFSDDAGLNYQTLTIPDGIYQVSDINSFLESQFALLEYDPNPISLYVNSNTLRIVVVIRTADFYVDFTHGKINELLGFASSIVTVTSQGTFSPDINVGIRRVNIGCDIIASVYNAGSLGNTIYSFTPLVLPGFSIVESPNNLVYLPLNRTSFTSITITVADQSGNVIDFQGEQVEVVLHLRRSGKTGK
jgi:hypothetical protein